MRTQLLLVKSTFPKWKGGEKLESYLMIIMLCVKETRSVTMNIFRKQTLFKSFVKIELMYIFTINMVSTAENCKEK